MSLVEDLLDVVRIVLEYFGVPPDMLVPVWNSQLCGQYRSIVRMIGSNLPLTPTPRVHFQIPLLSHRPHVYVDVAVDTRTIPSFADVLWVFEDEGDSFARTRNHLPPKSAVNPDVVSYSAPGPNQTQRGVRSGRQTANPDALKKITALENELLKLRAQIAMIVTAAPASESQNIPGTPVTSSSHPPAFTSTPHCAPPPPLLSPPPPPPPPPPPYHSSSTETSSIVELIHQRRKNGKGLDNGQLKAQDSGLSRGLGDKGIPSMLDVLKDLNQVKLRSVERSPGGTPLGRRRSRGTAAILNDPAALIAEALKRKFAHHRHNISSDKENSLDLSPFGSPEMPKVPQYTRRSQGRRHLLAH